MLEQLCGLRGTALKWCSDYLTNRSQSVMIGGYQTLIHSAVVSLRPLFSTRCWTSSIQYPCRMLLRTTQVLRNINILTISCCASDFNHQPHLPPVLQRELSVWFYPPVWLTLSARSCNTDSKRTRTSENSFLSLQEVVAKKTMEFDWLNG